MFLDTIESKGLAHISYVLGDEDAGVAVVIDPRRDVDVYLQICRSYGVRVSHVLETHIHADFVSGSTDLAAAIGAEIVGGRSEQYGFPIRQVGEDDEICVGPKIKIRVIETPGHTLEHVSYLVSGGRGSEGPWGLFTGDTLFAGEVGRPDLMGSDQVEGLAKQLYHTLFDKLLKLGDEVEVYPAHGKGSPCGGSIGDRLTSTIGYERMNNPKFKAKTEKEFVDMVLRDLPPAPKYYPRMKKTNGTGPKPLRCLATIQPVEPGDIEGALVDSSILVLDTREIEAFAGAHVPGSINIALRDEFPVWAGWMLEPDQKIVLVLDRHDDLDAVQRHLLRIGIENIAGFLRHGIRGWIEGGKEFSCINNISVHELNEILSSNHAGIQVLDVRTEAEWCSGKIRCAKHAFLGYFDKELGTQLDSSRPVLTYCGSGYRASIAASVLQRKGFQDVRNLPGSMKAWKAAGFSTVRPCEE